jgi:hypothetical protein
MPGVLGDLITALKGPVHARRMHARALQSRPGIRSGIEQLQRLCPAPPEEREERPIFLLSAGWRSGSTLLQRLLMSDPDVLIWGEPYDECGIIQALAESTQAFRSDWPPSEYYYDGRATTELTGAWIANLFPSPQDWRKGHRAVFEALFAAAALRAGARRWGVKEVRLGIEHVHYLRWLYPAARFVFLYRNPLAAYQSYCRYGRSWYHTWPHRPVFTPSAFGAHWRATLQGFLAEAREVGALLIRYEDLIQQPAVADEIERHLDIRVDRKVLAERVGSADERKAGQPIGTLERWLLRRATAPVAAELGYKW